MAGALARKINLSQDRQQGFQSKDDHRGLAARAVSAALEMNRRKPAGISPVTAAGNPIRADV
jgi:hypothetical protein